MSVLNRKTSGYVNLSYCVSRAQANLDDFSDKLKEKMTQFAINCFTSLNVMGKHSIEVDYFTMDANGVIDLSTVTDFIDYVKIGIPVNGKIWLLSKNDKILQKRDELSDAQAALIFNGNSDYDPGYGYYFADHYLNGALVSGLFGLGGGFSRSYFRLDKELNQIQFDTAVPNGEIIMEYTSTGVKVTGATTVPRYLVDYIVAFIHDELTSFDPKSDRFEKVRRHNLFVEQENLMINYKYRFDPDEYISMRYENVKQTPKR